MVRMKVEELEPADETGNMKTWEPCGPPGPAFEAEAYLTTLRSRMSAEASQAASSSQPAPRPEEMTAAGLSTRCLWAETLGCLRLKREF